MELKSSPLVRFAFTASILPEVGVLDLHCLCDRVVSLLGLSGLFLSLVEGPSLCLVHRGWNAQRVSKLSQRRLDNRQSRKH